MEKSFRQNDLSFSAVPGFKAPMRSLQLVPKRHWNFRDDDVVIPWMQNKRIASLIRSEDNRKYPNSRYVLEKSSNSETLVMVARIIEDMRSD